MTELQIQYFKQLLRNVAEVDPNDVIANQASQLAVDLEQPAKISNLSETEVMMIQYAVGKKNTYILLPAKKHAQNTERHAVITSH